MAARASEELVVSVLLITPQVMPDLSHHPRGERIGEVLEKAMAAGSVFLLLQSMFGLSFSPDKPQIRLENPSLPSLLNWVRIHNLRIGDATVDLALHRHPRDVGLNVERKEGDVQIVVMG